MLNSPSPVNFVHVKRIAPACYEARLKFQNVVLTGGPLYIITKANANFSDISLNYDTYKANGGNLSKLKYLKAARQAIRETIEEEILPLMNF